MYAVRHSSSGYLNRLPVDSVDIVASCDCSGRDVFDGAEGAIRMLRIVTVFVWWSLIVRVRW